VVVAEGVMTNDPEFMSDLGVGGRNDGGNAFHGGL
jgi:hypothetical protein